MLDRSVRQGIAASPGWAIATAHVLSAHALTVAHHHISAAQIDDEQRTLKAAFEAVHAELDVLSSDTRHKELHALLEVHRQMLTDPVLYDAALDYVAQQLVNAAWALSEQVQQLVLTFEAMDDAYLSERALDVRQVGQRVLRHLAGTEPAKPTTVSSPPTLPSGNTSRWRV
jgi:phosphoenolpyruvate-protein phosphotransferase (PTS system enzyme I)